MSSAHSPDKEHRTCRVTNINSFSAAVQDHIIEQVVRDAVRESGLEGKMKTAFSTAQSSWNQAVLINKVNARSPKQRSCV